MKKILIVFGLLFCVFGNAQGVKKRLPEANPRSNLTARDTVTGRYTETSWEKAAGYIQPYISGSSSDNQQLQPLLLSNNVLTIPLENGGSQSIDLSELSGSVDEAQVQNVFSRSFPNAIQEIRPENKNNHTLDLGTATFVETVTELQTAIANASNGDQIVIREGFDLDMSGSTTRIDIDKELLISGENVNAKNIINTGTSRSYFNIISPRVDIANLEFVGGYQTETPGDPIGTPPDELTTRTAIIVDGVDDVSVYNLVGSGYTTSVVNFKNSQNSKVFNCYMYNQKRIGLGYGVLLEGDSQVVIFDNVFRQNRHHLSGTGEAEMGVDAYNNYFGKSGMSAGNKVHVVDMHEINGNAGKYFNIYNNYFEDDPENDTPCIVVRGYPSEIARIYNNTFVKANRARSIRQTKFDLLGTGANDVVPNTELVNIEVFGNKFMKSQEDFLDPTDQLLLLSDKGIVKHNLFTKKSDIIANLEGYDFFVKGKFYDNREKYVFFFEDNVQLFDPYLEGAPVFYDLNISLDIKQVVSGNFTGTGKEDLIIVDTNNDFYLIEISSSNAVTQTQILTGISNETIIAGNFSSQTVDDLIIVQDNGDFILRENNNAVFDLVTNLGNFPNHTDLTAGDYSNNGYDDLFSKIDNNGYIFRIIAGSVRNGDPVVRSSNITRFSNFFVKRVDGAKDELLSYSTGGEIVWFSSANALSGISFIDISYAGVIDDLMVINEPIDATGSGGAVDSVAGLTGTISSSDLRSALNVEDGAAGDQTGAEIESLLDGEIGTGYKENNYVDGGTITGTGNKTLTLTRNGLGDITIPFTDLQGDGGDGSETIVQAGSNITVTGIGTTGDPYIINSTASGGSGGQVDSVVGGTNIDVDNADPVNPILSTTATRSDLSYDPATRTIINSGGNNTSITLAGEVNPGLMPTADKIKINGIEANAKDDQTGSEIVSAIDTELGQTDWKSGGGSSNDLETIQVACSDLTTDITIGATKAYFPMPYDATLSNVRLYLLTPGTVTGMTLDVNENGTSVFSTVLTTDATEKSSATASTQAVISDTTLNEGSEITIDFDSVPTEARGVIVTFDFIRL